MWTRTMLCVAIALTAMAYASGPAAAQQDAIKRTILQRSDVPGTNYETVLGIAEIAPNAQVALHTHPGTETSYLLEGSLSLQIQGQPPQALQAGQSFHVPAVAPHGGHAGPTGAKVLATWVVEKGKPLASPVK